MTAGHVTQSAGGVVLNRHGAVVVVSQHGDSWSLPKGHLDPGEDAETAARREVAEESGITELTLVRPLGSYTRCRIGKGGIGEDCREMKEIHMFLFTTDMSELSPTDSENPEARWVPIAEVAGMLSHPKDAAFFTSVAHTLHD